MAFLSSPLAFPLGYSLSASLVAKIIPDEQEAVIGSTVKLDGRQSTSTGNPITDYNWYFTQVPIGSQVGSSSFVVIEEDGSVVSFAPDITGVYKINLVITDGVSVSEIATAVVEIRVILVPNHQGLVPDASFIWNYLSDFWTQVTDRDRFESVWSGSIQVIAGEMLKLYQYQYNKSIRDIQDLIQKRWISFSPGLDIEPGTTQFILADDTAGSLASTFVLDPQTGLPISAQPNYSNIVTIPLSEGDFLQTSYGKPTATGRLLQITGRSYTFARAVDSSTISSFFADRNQVPAGFSSRAWRFSSTLVSSTVDFEKQGVSPGDIMQVEVTRLDTNLLSNIFMQVVSVDRNRLGFVMNLEDLVDGVAGGGLTDDMQVTLATDLIVSGLFVNSDGSLSYGLDAAVINTTVHSIGFRRSYFETLLNQDTAINVGPFSIKVRPVTIIRNKKIAVDSAFVSVPILQEYIKQPNILEDAAGNLSVLVNGVPQSIPRRPYLLSENLDYIIDDESMISGVCEVTAAVNTIVLPNGDLLDRSVQTGDTISISIGVTEEVFDILEVLTADTIKVFPTPSIGSTSALYTVNRRLAGKYIRFIETVFTKTRPAPKRLWSEVSYLDNGQAIEDNFGILVGIRREDLARVGSGIPYRSAVAGLMYALTTGPTIANLNLSAQILLGFPFSSSAGIIREINPSFRTRDDGSPLFGRLLIDVIDKQGKKTGITNIYFYPQGTQIFDVATSTWLPALPEFSGLAINPATGVEYAVGDTVAQFAPLSKGVEIEEYLSTPGALDQVVAQGNVAALLQKYHSFTVLINSDLVSTADVDLVAEFMNRVKAHYVRMTSGLFKLLDDTVDITDAIFFSRELDAYDSSNMGTPSAVMFDGTFDVNESFLSVDGLFYTRFLSGSDLVTTKDSTTVSSSAGHFLTAGTDMKWDAPLIRPGDLLRILSGPNAEDYTVSSVIDDNHIVLDLTGRNVEDQTLQAFNIYRPIQNPIWVGKVLVTHNTATVTVKELDATNGGVGAAGVQVGDVLVFADLTVINSVVSQRYNIIDVHVDPINPSLKLDTVVGEVNGTYTAWVVRKGLVAQGHIVPYGSAGENFYADLVSTADNVVFNDTVSHHNSWLNLAMLMPGDEIIVDSVPYQVLWFKPSTRQALVTPPLLTTATDKQVTVVLRPGRATTPVSVDFLDRFPSDSLQLDNVASATTGDKASTTATSKDVTLTVETPSNYARPGDYLILLEGADSSIDIGFGAGIYPIHKLTGGGSTIHLRDALTATGNFRYGIRRRRPNEG